MHVASYGVPRPYHSMYWTLLRWAGISSQTLIRGQVTQNNNASSHNNALYLRRPVSTPKSIAVYCTSGMIHIYLVIGCRCAVWCAGWRWVERTVQFTYIWYISRTLTFTLCHRLRTWYLTRLCTGYLVLIRSTWLYRSNGLTKVWRMIESTHSRT